MFWSENRWRQLWLPHCQSAAKNTFRSCEYGICQLIHYIFSVFCAFAFILEKSRGRKIDKDSFFSGEEKAFHPCLMWAQMCRTWVRAYKRHHLTVKHTTLPNEGFYRIIIANVCVQCLCYFCRRTTFIWLIKFFVGMTFLDRTTYFCVWFLPFIKYHFSPLQCNIIATVVMDWLVMAMTFGRHTPLDCKYTTKKTNILKM